MPELHNHFACVSQVLYYVLYYTVKKKEREILGQYNCGCQGNRVYILYQVQSHTQHYQKNKINLSMSINSFGSLTGNTLAKIKKIII